MKKMIYPIGEALEQRLCRAVKTDAWHPVQHVLAKGVALKTFTCGQPLVLHCGPETASLQFLRHGWSGAAAVSVNGECQVVELALDEDSDVLTVGLPEQKGVFEVRIEALPVEGREQTRNEVWLLGVEYRVEPLAFGRSALINAGSRVVYGDWGEFLTLASDETIPDAIVREGSWAPDDIEVFKKNVRPGDVVVDVGANIGHHSVVFSKLVGKDGLVIAIEAQRLMYQCVNANLLLNRCENVIPIRAAAGADRGSVSMYPVSYDAPRGNFGALGIDVTNEHQKRGEEVPCHRLDELLPEYLHNRKVSFVKIDVQSYELFVLQGMTDFLAHDRPTIFVEISPVWMRRAGYEFTEIYALLRKHGYELIHREGTELDENEVPIVPLGADIEWDILAVHPDKSN